MLNIFSIKDKDKNNIVLGLLEHIKVRDERISVLEAEVAHLKKLPDKPKLKPSNIGKKDKSISKKVSTGRKKVQKSKDIKIHKTVILKPPDLSPNAKLHSFREYVVQDIEINLMNTKYVREVYKTPEGKYLCAPLPEQLKSHYGPKVRRYILYQHYALHVPHNAIRKQLQDIGLKISSGTINDILTKSNDIFYKEKESLLKAGLENSSYVTVDDTGMPHNGKNGYCTHIGNELFTYFKSSDSKSRLNFLKILNQGKETRHINGYTIDYLKLSRFPQDKIALLARAQGRKFSDMSQWESFLKNCSITGEGHIRTATEAGLIGSITQTGYVRNISIISDEAPQFKVFVHGLCWIHTERKINSLTPESELQAKEQKKIIDQIWKFYKLLKFYKKFPSHRNRKRIENIFDLLFSTPKVNWVALKDGLESIHKNKKELLLVMDRPEIPLHTNQSENDLREIVKKRKISAGTRSTDGRISRDTFISLKKTTMKLGISFWDYLLDRINSTNSIKPLSQIIAQMAFNTS